jgi:hypothetical protein
MFATIVFQCGSTAKAANTRIRDLPLSAFSDLATSATASERPSSEKIRQQVAKKKKGRDALTF